MSYCSQCNIKPRVRVEHIHSNENLTDKINKTIEKLYKEGYELKDTQHSVSKGQYSTLYSVVLVFNLIGE